MSELLWGEEVKIRKERKGEIKRRADDPDFFLPATPSYCQHALAPHIHLKLTPSTCHRPQEK